MGKSLIPHFDEMPILCLSSAGWDTDTPVNVHHIMGRLADNHRILWVDSQPMRMPRLTKSDVGKVFGRFKTAVGGVRELRGNMWGITPRGLPLTRSSWMRNWNDRRLRKTIYTACESVGLPSFVLWAFSPSWAGIAGTMGETLTVYHCVDDYAANPGVNSQLVANLERRLLCKADVVIVTSQPLLRKLEQVHHSVHLVQAGVDQDFFLSELPELPGDLRDIPSPRIGFTGAISGYKVDIEMLAEAAGRCRDVSFVLIGPVGAGDPFTDISRLSEFRNVYLLGSRDHKALPSYLYHMDALMLPSPDTPTMTSSFPVKMFEYLATGKPIIARDQEPLREYGSLIHLAASRSEFIEGIGKVLDEHDDSKTAARIEVARNNTWERRLQQIGQIMEDAIMQKQAGEV